MPVPQVALEPEEAPESHDKPEPEAAHTPLEDPLPEEMPEIHETPEPEETPAIHETSEPEAAPESSVVQAVPLAPVKFDFNKLEFQYTPKSMFCAGCGKDLSQVKGSFCHWCGTSKAEPEQPVPVHEAPMYAPPVHAPMYSTQALAPPKHAAVYTLPAQAESTPAPSNVNQPAIGGWQKAIASLLVITLIISMLYGWVSFSRMMEYGGEPLSWLSFEHIVAQNWHNTVYRDHGLMTFAIISIIAWAGTSLSIIGLALFSILMHVRSKKAVVFGVISSLIAIAMAAMYFVYLYVIVGGEGFEARGGDSRLLELAPSIWVYITLGAGVVSLIFMIIFNKKLNTKVKTQ